MWWTVFNSWKVHEWQKVELQTSWKLKPCYRYLERVMNRLFYLENDTLYLKVKVGRPL